MSSNGIMRCAALLAWVLVLHLPAPFAQESPAQRRDDLDVTMRVIVDPDAKVPDEIVRRIPLPKPAQPAASPAPGNPSDKPKEPKDPKDPKEPQEPKKPGPAPPA